MKTVDALAQLEDYYVQRDVIGVFDSFLLFTSQV
jgi:hypothetical protein